MKKLFLVPILAVLLLTTTVLAKGNPWKQVWDAINAMLQDISDLQNRVDELEARVSALEQVQGECVSGETRVCGSDVGECVTGIETCVNFSWSGVCEGEVGPSPEICDGLDNDCDGNIDGFTETCPLQYGVCAGTTHTCENGSWSECDYGPYYEPEETSCDYLDNDCDGQVDEGC